MTESVKVKIQVSAHIDFHGITDPEDRGAAKVWAQVMEMGASLSNSISGNSHEYKAESAAHFAAMYAAKCLIDRAADELKTLAVRHPVAISVRHAGESNG